MMIDIMLLCASVILLNGLTILTCAILTSGHADKEWVASLQDRIRDADASVNRLNNRIETLETFNSGLSDENDRLRLSIAGT